MTFRTEKVNEASLGTLEDVKDWISDTEKNLRRVPVRGILESGAIVRDDEYLGDGDTLLRFNKAGFTALCQKIGIRQDFLERLETPLLTSQVLNDLLSQKKVKEALGNDEFVLDERTGTIIGLVTKTYVTYSNQRLLQDLTERIDGLGSEEAMTFHHGYGVNTVLTLRFKSLIRHGTIRGRGGVVDDKSEFGLNFANSMVGTSSVRISYFVYRLICANGLMVPVADSVSRVNHSGNADSFQSRLTRCFDECARGINQLQGMLNGLSSLTFDPAKLALDSRLVDQVFGVVAGSKQAMSEFLGTHLRFSSDATPAEREQRRREHDTWLISKLPLRFGGDYSARVFRTTLRDKATMFDFINVFTEFAKAQPVSERLEIEENAGALAKFIADNSRKF